MKQIEYKKQYDEYFLHSDLDMTIRYRYYNQIEVDQDSVTDDESGVVMTVRLGTYTDSTYFGLKKDEGVWKLDLYPLMEQKTQPQ